MSSENREFDEQDQNTLMDLLLLRRDVRGNNFQRTPIQEDHLQTIFDAAAAAPSVGLSQPWEFVIVDDAAIKNQVYHNYVFESKKAEKMFDPERKSKYKKLKLEGIKEAPINIAVYYRPPEQTIIGNNSMREVGEYSVVCAIQNMWLMARALNIGMGWVSIVDPNHVNALLGAPPQNKLIAYLCLGYVKEFHPIPELEVLKWGKRQAISEVIYANRFPRESAESGQTKVDVDDV